LHIQPRADGDAYGALVIDGSSMQALWPLQEREAVG
jgi:hypothetical protein